MILRLALTLLAVSCAAARAAPVHDFLSVAVSPDGTRIASVEGDEDYSGTADIRTVVLRGLAGGEASVLKMPCGAVHDCTPSSLAWAPDGSHLTFVLRSPGSHARAVYTVRPDGTDLRKIAAFDGTLVSLRYGPGGQLAVLAVASAAKEVGATEAGAAITGVLGADVHEQRLAILQPDGSLHYASPPDLFVYEYDWMPDGHGFVGTAAPGDGDNNWWVAKLYSFDAGSGAARVIHAPASPQEQIAQPKVSPDGRSVAYIAGLMSDFGSNGGDATVLPLGQPGAQELVLTDGWPATVTSLEWACKGHNLVVGVLRGDQTQLVQIGGAAAQTPPAPIVSVEESLHGQDTAVSGNCHTPVTATVHQSFTRAPEIEAGLLGQWHDVTHANAGQTVDLTARSITWTDDHMSDQGWLLLPGAKQAGAYQEGAHQEGAHQERAHHDGADHDGAKLGMITDVHGGPASANRPHYVGQGLVRQMLEAGYAVFLPNPRGSFGQGETFTLANVKDFGHGDLRDILAGVTAAEHAAPIDDHRLGLTGWSYGGYMTMWAVTQTQRFRAAVAGAGIADWQSYYGENGIDAWMIPYFGASVYADPAVYAKSSPITYITKVHTPTLSVVGENDIECPAPQTEEFWHALHDLGVPTASVIYPGEGHGLRKPADVADYERRTLAWFKAYLK